ncbi:hypothetical protein D7X48_13880 [bacterium D16-50]|nr:hypothetical protein D7X48_13880 [bacterium D16-50]
MQVKGRVAFAGPPARFTPPGKAVRERKMPPRDTGFLKTKWLGRKTAGESAEKEDFHGWLGVSRAKKGGRYGRK